LRPEGESKCRAKRDDSNLAALRHAEAGLTTSTRLPIQRSSPAKGTIALEVLEEAADPIP
jgi:hypothetical protein